MNGRAHHDDLELAFRVVAGDTPPTCDLPFHHHGQFGPGRLDKRCILQTESWVDREGAAHSLTAMSREYRGNVLAFLRRESPQWMLDAYALEVAMTITGVIEPAQASIELAALRSLPPGWVDHTPLGLMLHQLNGTQPDPLPLIPAPRTPEGSDSPEILQDHDAGVWTVTTRSHSRYLLDLDRRRLRRLPGFPTNGDHPVAQLFGDGEWTPLTALVDCAVGSPLLVLDDRDGVDSYRRSTDIRSIRRTIPDPGDTS